MRCSLMVGRNGLHWGRAFVESQTRLHRHLELDLPPLGMTGTRLLLTLLLELRRRGKKRGLATACIGGGQGIAAIVETVA